MIRYSKILILCVAFATLTYSCAKEFSASNPFIIPAKGSLLDSSGGCLPSVVHGAYYNGVKTNPDSNYVQLIVHVASVGAYKIVSDTANGLIFKDSGFFYKTGYDTIHLKAEGTPAVPQTDLFSITFDSTIAPGCSFEVVVNDSTGRGNGSTGTNAMFSLETASTACSNTVVNGTYSVSVPLTTTNTIIVPVNVTTAGTYTLETNTVNGYKFAASGTFTSTGNQNVTLMGSGTPIAMGVDVFKPQLGSITGCSYTVNVAAAPAPAVFTLDGSPSACTNATVNGTYAANSALTSANTITISANVISAGAFSITTNAVNGMTFSASGIFTSTGAQPVTLTGSGTPAASGAFSFTPAPNGCTFNVNVVSGGSTGSGNYLRCKIDGVLTNFNTGLVGLYTQTPSSGIPYSITAHGTNSDIAGSKEEFWVNASNPTAPTTGVYNNITFSSGITDRGCQVGLYPTGFPNLYWGTSVLSSNTFSVNVTSVSASGATGTFSGIIYESNGIGPRTKNVTDGEFKITY